MKSSQLWPLTVLPFAFAVGLSFAAASNGKLSPLFAATLALVAIPCGLLGMSIALLISYLRTLEDRIKRLEERTTERSQ